MLRTALLIILIGLTIALPLVARSINKKEAAKGRATMPLWWVWVPMLVITLIYTVAVCTAIVPPKTQGVVVTFGKADVDSSLDPGLNFKAPWSDVVNVSTTRQTDVYNDSKRDDSGNTRYHEDILVRLGSNSPAWVKVTYAWQPDEDAVGQIFTDFRADDPTAKLYEDFVQVVVKAAVNKAAGTYNPVSVLADIAASDDPVTAIASQNLSPDLDELGRIAIADLDDRIAAGSNGPIPLVQSISLEFSYVQFNEDTERDIDNFQQEIQKTINSQQAIKTAENVAAANAIVAESISKEPAVLTSRCLDLIRDGFNPPPAFSCFGPSTAQPVVPVGTPE